MAPTVVRSFTEKPGMGWLRHRIALSHAVRDFDGITMMSVRMGYPLLSDSDYRHLRKENSTLFILGSGESVEEVTTKQWDFVRRSTSVGINSWVVHDFVPDAYSFEEVKDGGYTDVSSTLSKLLTRPEVLARRPRILMLRPHASTPASRVVDIPSDLRSEVRLYGRTTLFTRDAKNLPRDIERVLISMVKNKVPAGISLDAGMSVSRLISLGARAGFHRIVLVGVDLNSPRYFFDVNTEYWDRRKVAAFNPWHDRGAVHGIEETTIRSFAASVIIPALSSAVRSVTGTEVFVSSESSALSSSLPVFRWADNGEIL